MKKLAKFSLGILLMGLLIPFAHAQKPSSNIGASHPYHLISAATDNATLVAAGPHVVYTITAVNTTTTLYYLKLYDIGTTPTCGTSSVAQTFPIPFGASNSGGGITINIPTSGLAFNSGVGLCIVSGIADNSDGSAATGIAVDVAYQ